MTIIELGEPGSAAATSARRRRDPHAAVRWAAVAVSLLGVASITGSARPAPAMTRPVWSIPISRASIVKVAQGTVFILSSGAGAQVTAYQLRNGAVRWSKRLPMSHGRMTAQEPGALMVPVGAATVALDLRTGAQMWRLPGNVVHATPETALLAEPDATVRQVRMADGAEIWSRRVDGAASWAVVGSEPRSAGIVAVTADGRVQVLRLNDGTVLSRGLVPNGSGVPVADGVGADAGILYVNRMETNRAAVTAYDLDSLNPRWRFAQESSDDLPNKPAARTCGVVMCFYDGTSTIGLDPGNGTVRWRAGGWIDAAPMTGGNRLLADSADHGWHVLIDSTSGKIVADLGAGTPVWDYTQSAPTYYLRDIERSGRRVAVSRINLRTGELQLRGIVGAVGFPGCTAAGDTLVCGTTDGRLAVTAVG